MDWDVIYIFIDRHKDLIPDYFKFDHVLIDEAQDLSITLMHIAIALMKQDTLIAMDANQRIYKNHWTMSELGIPTKSKYLKKSFRCTKQIDSFAECLRIHNENALDADDLARHVSPEIDGPLPIVINFANTVQEFKYIVSILKFYLQDPETRTAIIVRINNEIQKWCEVLSDALIPHVVITGKRNELKNAFRTGTFTSYSDAGILSPGVKICTIHSAKGLEFHNVIIPHFNDKKYPPSFLISGSDEEEDNSEDLTVLYRNLSYVAMTRARGNLIVSFDKYPSLYLDEIDDDLFEYYDLSGDDKNASNDLHNSLKFGSDANIQRHISSEGCTEDYGPDSSNVLTESKAKEMSVDDLLDYDRGCYEYHKARADRGYPSSIYQVAVMLEQGIGVEKNMGAALRTYFKAATDNEDPSVDAQCRLGSAFLTGIPGLLEPNMEEAIAWLSAAVGAGSITAMRELVKCYDGTYGVKNKPAMLDLLSKLGDTGDSEAINILISSSFDNDHNAYVHWLTKSADQGDINSCYTLGLIYQEGKITVKDSEKAFDYLMLAADMGHSLAQCEVALHFIKGEGIDLDYKAGLSWLDSALDQECPYAYSILGQCYYMGWGVDIDYDQAEEYIHQSNKLGYEKASVYLNELNIIREEREYAEVSYGTGMFFDEESFSAMQPEKAKELFESAANRGSPVAKFNLAKLKLGTVLDYIDAEFHNNKDPAISKTMSEIFTLLRSSANANCADACYLLCRLYDDGFFSDKDMSNDRYAHYLSIAAESNIVDAQRLYIRWTLDGFSDFLVGTTAYGFVSSLMGVDSEFTLLLARCYLQGVGICYNPEVARHLLLKLQSQGYPFDEKYLSDAEQNLQSYKVSNKNYGDDIFFFRGSAPLSEPDEYYSIFLAASEKNESGAQLNLARCYFNGIGVGQDVEKAIHWLSKSMMNNNSDAYYVAYSLIEDGISLDPMPNDSLVYLTKAADNGNLSAMNTLGERLENDRDPSMRVQAFEYYRKAALMDYPPAFYNLGYCYEMGKGTSQDKRAAYQWYIRASEYYNLPKISNGIARVRDDLIKMGASIDEL